MPRRPGRRTILSTATRKPRSAAIAPSPRGPSGSAVTKREWAPSKASETATLASPPPKVASSVGDWKRRSRRGARSRSMISPRGATSRPPAPAGEGGGEGPDHPDPAEGLGREELHAVEAQPDGAHELARGRAARQRGGPPPDRAPAHAVGE